MWRYHTSRSRPHPILIVALFSVLLLLTASPAAASMCSDFTSPSASDCTEVPPGVRVEADGARVVVEAAGSSPDDANRLQWAGDCVTPGGTVELEDDFALELSGGACEEGLCSFSGDPCQDDNDCAGESVELRNSLHLTGSRDRGRGDGRGHGRRGRMATIHGGHAALCINAPEEDVVISDLAIEGASLAGVWGWSGGTITLTGLHIQNVVPGEVPGDRFHLLAFGIQIGESTLISAEEPRFTGSIIVSHNRVENVGLIAIGVYDFDQSAVEVLVEGNEISGAPMGIDVAGVVLGTTTVGGNVICGGAWGGIAVRGHVIPGGSGDTVVVNNEVYGGGAIGGGIYLWGTGWDHMVIASHNLIVGSSRGVTLQGSSTTGHVLKDIEVRAAETGIEIRDAPFNFFSDIDLEVTGAGILLTVEDPPLELDPDLFEEGLVVLRGVGAFEHIDIGYVSGQDDTCPLSDDDDDD